MPSLSTDHRASGDASVIAPTFASEEDLPSPWLCIFFAAAADSVDNYRQ